jgi:hypothetical protein
VLYEQKGGFVREEQFLDLHAGEHVNIVQRFVPDIQMRFFARLLARRTFFFWPPL